MKIQNPLYFFIGQIPVVRSFVVPDSNSQKLRVFRITFWTFSFNITPIDMLISSPSHPQHSSVTFAYCRYFCSFSIRSIRFSQYENSKPLVFFHRPNSVRLFVRKYPTQIPKKFECLESLFEHYPWISHHHLHVNIIHPFQTLQCDICLLPLLL